MQKFTTKIVDMMKSEGLFEWQGGPIILSQVCLQLIHSSSVLMPCFWMQPTFGFRCPSRLRTSLGPWSGIRVNQPGPTRRGQLTWHLRWTQVFHGSCAKKMMRRIQLYVLCFLSLTMHLGQHFFNVLGSDLVTIVHERKLIMVWMICDPPPLSLCTLVH